MSKKKNRNTKGKIISAAWKLFYEQGYDDTTIEDIIEESQTSRGSFYHYFEGKEPKNAREKILIYQILMDYLWAVWTCIKEAQGDDFGTYGMDRYKRAIEYLKNINI